MNMRKLINQSRVYRVICLMVMVACFAACGEKDDWDVEYVPFQESEGGNWGLISPDGDVLFSEEFKEMPSVALNGRFIVRNADGLFEIYTAEKKPQKVGGEYLSVGLFYDKVAPAVEKGKPIQFIDKDGDVEFVFDKVDGKTVTSCSDIINGTAVFKCGDYYGVVSSSGKVLIEPKYVLMEKDPSNRFLCVDKKYMGELDEDKVVWQVLDKDGDELFSMKASKFKIPEQLSWSFADRRFIFDDMFILKTEKDGHNVCGLMKFDGEWMLKPSSKVRSVVDYREGKLVYYDGTGYGLMDKEGEIIIRAKYDKMRFVTDEILMVKKSGESEYTLINIEDEEIGNDSYRTIHNVKMNGENLFAKVGKKEWALIDLAGKEVKLKTSIEDIFEGSFNTIHFSSQNYISDYVDVDALVNSLNLTDKGPAGLTFNQSPEAVIKALNSNAFLSHLSENADEHEYQSISSSGTLELLNTFVNAIFDQDVTEGIYETKTVKGFWGNSYQEKKLVGRRFTNAHPESLEVQISLNDKVNGRPEGIGELIIRKVIEKIKTLGKVVKEGKNAACVDVDGASYVAYYDGEQIRIAYGKDFDVENTDVSLCDDASEDNVVSMGIPALVRKENQTEPDDDDWGELESPPAEELMSDYHAPAPETKETRNDVVKSTGSKQKQSAQPERTKVKSQTTSSSSSSSVRTSTPTQSGSDEKSVNLNDLINYTNKKK